MIRRVVLLTGLAGLLAIAAAGCGDSAPKVSGAMPASSSALKPQVPAGAPPPQ